MTDYSMNPALQADVLRDIERQFGGKEKGKYINQIECPTCGKREAFTSSESPWVIKCGRANNCGESHHVKELFPHLFESWTERYQPATEAERIKNPTAVADGYLRDGRGFELSRIRGWYTQEWYQNHELDQGSTTVRFAMPNGFWERVLDKPERFGKLKARAVGDFKGLAWVPPMITDAELAEAERIVITEGIFDAISWIHAGWLAVSNISSSNYPDAFFDRVIKACAAAGKTLPKLYWAQDGDKAGRTAIKKFVERSEKQGFDSRAAQPPQGRISYDWNDLHQLGRMAEKDIENYLYFGELLLAKSAFDKGVMMYFRRPRRQFWFTYGFQLYWWTLDQEAYEKQAQEVECKNGQIVDEKVRNDVLRSTGAVKRIATAVPKPLYFQANEVTNEQWYYLAIETDEGTSRLSFTPKQLTSAAEFKNRMLAVKNAWYTGTGKQLEIMLMDMTTNLKTVETIDYIGYSKKHKTWVFNEVAVRDGRIAKINDEDFFQFGRLQIKTLAASPELNINTKKEEYDATWPAHLSGAFGTTGMVALAFFTGSLFAEQIRDLQDSFPFFELVGEAGAGKSTLVEFLWRLLGRGDYEGFDPQKTTPAARARLFNQCSNMPVSLIESDREETDRTKAKQFDWDDLKTAYNGRSMRSRGMKTSGNDTYEPPFRGTVLITQNAQVQAGEAILSRIVHKSVTRAFQTLDTKIHADWLAQAPMESVSYFTLMATMAEKELLDLVTTRTALYEQQILAGGVVRMFRIAKNHAQMISLVDCLGPDGLNLFPIHLIEACRAELLMMAAERQQTINADHPLVQEFWEAVDYIESAGAEWKLNHEGFSDGTDHDGNVVKWAINLKEFERWAGDYRLRIPELRTLKTLLKTSKTRKFIEANRCVRSKLVSEKTLKCWIFETPRGKRDA